MPGSFESVGSVVLNRVESGMFPENIRAVIFQGADGNNPAFSSVGGAPVETARFIASANPSTLLPADRMAFDAALSVAARLIDGTIRDTTGGSTFFFDTSLGDPPAGFFERSIRTGRLEEAFRIPALFVLETVFLGDTEDDVCRFCGVDPE